MKFKIAFTYEMDGKQYVSDKAQDENYSLKVTSNDKVIKVLLDAKKPMTVKKFALKFDYKYQNDDRIYVNGYQSWTDSREHFIYEKMDGLNKVTDFLINTPLLANIGLNRAGDETFYKFPHKPSFFYGFSYGYVRRGENIEIYGSLSERSGYTIVEFDVNNSCINVRKELEGVVFEGEKELLDFAIVSGGYDEAFDEYFALMNVKAPEKRRYAGYTTWYNYYGSINQEIVERDLKALSSLDKKFDIFQIDDGYQAAIGDWLITDEKKFPKGMKYIADEIHKKDMLAGIWIAPFAGTKNSKLFKEHRDWFITDEKGKPYVTGPNWGSFYSLDIYNEGARAYIKHFFDVILNEWGYDMVKLDFLYGACIRPMHNKTRGEIMCDAMDLLRECVGDKLILGCGVPLMPSFGKVDFCRIGADIDLKWYQKKFAHREEVTTHHAVMNTIFRRHLDSRAFMNDPDVFLLRDKNIRMDFEHRRLLAKINSLFGNLLFVSDTVSEYSDEQMKTFLETAFSPKAEIISAEFTKPDIIKVEYVLEGKKDEFSFNCKNGNLE